MAVQTTNNKPINPRGNDQSPKGYNRAALYSGKALDFDGVNDEISIGSANFLGLGTGSFSFAWYINSSESVDFQCVIDYRHTSGIGVLIDHRLGGIGGALQTAEGNFAFDVTSATSSVSGDVFDGKWHHVVFVADRSTSNTRVTFYIDGQLHYYDVNTNAQTSTIEDGQQMYFGGQGGTQYVDASLSSLKAFNVALTAAQVSDLYNNPEKIVPTGVEDTALKLWLPMMEGAGTTAYDGSGNGNHGTISGATWTHGIGSPVAQTAVIDWNKGTNELQYSEDFSAAAGWSVLTFLGGTLSVTNNYAEAPDGRQTAARIQATHNNTDANSYGILSATATSGTTGNYVGSFWVKSNTGSNQTFSAYVRNNLSGDTHTATSEWTRIELQGSGSSNYLNFGTFKSQGSDASIDILVWGGQINDGTAVTPYTPTIGTTQPNDVLLPQGLTSGRDITGVNLFENVRKQGALNLDGNSWAEVHDNASLDITDAITLEAWVYNIQDGTTAKGIMGQWYGAVGGAKNSLLYKSDDDDFQFYVNISGVSYNITTGDSVTSGWHHIVGIYDGSNMKIYVDGAESATTARTGTLDTSTGAFEIGRYFGLLSNITNTPIAQPRIYNRALTAEEVQRNYDAGKNIYTNS